MAASAGRSAALARARARRRELDRDRDARDRRLEELTAATLVELDALTAAREVTARAERMVGAALRALLEQDAVTVERAAALVDLDPALVRRLLRGADSGPAADADSRDGRLTSGARAAEVRAVPGLPSGREETGDHGARRAG